MDCKHFLCLVIFHYICIILNLIFSVLRKVSLLSTKIEKINVMVNMTPNQVTHVRMPETAVYSSMTTDDKHVVKMTNPVKA